MCISIVCPHTSNIAGDEVTSAEISSVAALLYYMYTQQGLSLVMLS